MKVSVIVPVYNVEKYLRRCIDSILAQTYGDIEVILVDDGSTDESNKICREYKDRDKRIKLVIKENGGLSSARNAGLKKASGNYVVFIDSDDYVCNEYIERLVELVRLNDAEMAVVGLELVTSGRPKLKDIKTQVEILDSRNALERMLLEKDFSVSANGKIYKRGLFSSIEYPEGRLYEDNGCTYKLIMRSKRIVCSNEKLYYYCIREKSITSSGFNIQKMDYIELTDAACEEIIGIFPGLSEACKCRMATVRISILRQMLNAKLSNGEAVKKRKIIAWLKENRRFLLKSKLASKKIKLSLTALSLGENLLKLMGNVYEKSK